MDSQMLRTSPRREAAGGPAAATSLLITRRATFAAAHVLRREGWTDRHNRWSTAEAREILTATGGGIRVRPTLLGTPIQRKRWMKERVWARMPPFWRAFAYFLHRYVVRLGFLDGIEGLIFHTLQGFWFRFLVGSKIYEARNRRGE